MTTRAGTARAAVAGSLVLGLLLAGCAPASSTISSTGRVLGETVTAQVPTLVVPRVNLNAGFAVTASTAANLSSVSALLGFGSAERVTKVEVRIGDRVLAGDVLVRFDDAALAANVSVAKADLAVAKSQVGVLDSAIDSTRDKEAELADKRVDVVDGIAKATKARKELTGKLAQARKAAKALPKQLAKVSKTLKDVIAKRPAVAKQLAQVQAALAALPPDAPPEVRAPLLAAQQQLTAALKQLGGAIKQLTAGRAKLKAAIKQVAAGIPKLAKVIRTIDTNLAKARDGLRKIDKAQRTIRNARADLKRARTLAVIAAGNDLAVRQARTARSRAVVTAPRDGTITDIATVGELLAPGATVAELSAPAHRVELWLASEQAARICVGDHATVAFGTNPAGIVSRILPLAQYPPTFHTTDEVHLTRAVPVEVSFAAALPPGVPVDVQISPCQTHEVNK